MLRLGTTAVAFVIGIGSLGLGCARELDNDAGSTSVESANDQDLASSVRSVTMAIIGGDAAAGYAHLSAECRAGLAERDYQVALVVLFNGLTEANDLFGRLGVSDVVVRSVSSNRGEARPLLTIDGTPVDTELGWQPWVYEDDAWRLDCDPGDIYSYSPILED
jgi:hypothetical protein